MESDGRESLWWGQLLVVIKLEFDIDTEELSKK